MLAIRNKFFLWPAFNKTALVVSVLLLTAVLAVIPRYSYASTSGNDWLFCLYDRIGFQGASFCSSAAQLSLSSEWNDRARSVKVRDSHQATLYKHWDFRGAPEVITANAHALMLDRNVSSIKVEPLGTLPTAAPVCFYRKPNLTRAHFCTRSARLRLLPFWDDNIRSVQVPTGYAVTLYQHPKLGGDTELLYADAPTLTTLVNQVSSFKIERLADSDGDGVYDPFDLFPNDPTESIEMAMALPTGRITSPMTQRPFPYPR